MERIDVIYSDVTSVENSVKEEDKKLYFVAKRLFDIVVSSISILFLFPAMVTIGIIIKLESKGPAIFVQKRVGENGKEFNMYKFRSMCNDAEAQLESLQHKNDRSGPVFKMSDDPRITKVGRILRKTCLDELPQLFNVFLSQMSFVGPRPPLPAEVEKYTEFQMKRLSAKPGLTCYWQISDREMDFDGWVELDLKYVKERSFLTDLKLIFKTFSVILSNKGDK